MDLGWNMPMLSYRNRTVNSGINQNVRPLRRSFFWPNRHSQIPRGLYINQSKAAPEKAGGLVHILVYYM